MVNNSSPLSARTALLASLVVVSMICLSGCYNHYLKKLISPINYAIQKGDYTEARKIVESGYDLNAPPAKQGDVQVLSTAIMYQAPSDFIDFLLDHGANPSPALFAAIGCKLPVNMRVNLDQGIPFDCSGESVELVKLLLDRGAKPDVTDPKTGVTALMSAASRGKRRVAELLLNRGSDLNAASAKGLRPIVFALTGKHDDVVKFFEERGAKASPDEAKLAEQLGQFCSRDTAKQIGYAMATKISEQGSATPLSDANLLCMEINEEYINGYIAGIESWRQDQLAQLRANMMPSVANLLGAADSIFHLHSRILKQAPIPPELKSAAMDTFNGAANGSAQNPACDCPSDKPFFQGGSCFSSRDEACRGVETCTISTCPK